jgi:hypothetical protein
VSLYSELIGWAEARPWWQQRVLARLASGEQVGPEEHAAIAESLLEPPPEGGTGGWMSKVRPPAESTRDQVKLLDVRDVKNVNRLRPDERLTFGADGVTVVFGFNGSGKSGYARLIKQMVRTRHREASDRGPRLPVPGSRVGSNIRLRDIDAGFVQTRNIRPNPAT